MAKKKERLRRDIAGVGPEPRRAGLHPLSGLKDFRIGKGEPDIRGWEVRTLNGRDVGRVDDLLVDTDAGEVVMLDIEMRGSDRHIELPIRSAQLDHETSRVIVDSGDVDLYAGSLADDTRTHGDPDDRGFGDRDLDGIPDREEVTDDERARRLREARRDDEDRARRAIELDEESLRRHDRTTRHARPPGAAADRDAIAPDSDTAADEVVVERRPVIEEVVIRRRVIDSD